MRSTSQILNRIWRKRGPAACALWPLSLVYQSAMACRRFLYQSGWFKVHHFDLPVIVVGNISVGGTGKTPVVIAIANFLRKEGWKPGIVSRGYGGATENSPKSVKPESDPNQVGDEPVLIARRTDCPIVVAPERAAAVRKLIDEYGCDVIVADDGLQHLTLGRDIEIAMVDGNARFGNGFCLPAGPLREPVSRLDSVDFVIANGGGGSGYRCLTEGNTATKVVDHAVSQSLDEFRASQVHAVAAIASPNRFFDHLRRAGLDIVEHPFRDHHKFEAAELQFSDDKPILMTEKDAVKCEGFKGRDIWYVPLITDIDKSFYDELLEHLKSYG